MLLILIYLCPPTAVCVSSCCDICVLQRRAVRVCRACADSGCQRRRLHMCPPTTIFVSSHNDICVLLLLCMCPRPPLSVLCPRAVHAVSGHARTAHELLNMCLRTTIYVSCSPEQYTRYQDMREQRMKALTKRKQRARDIALLSSEAEVLLYYD